MKVPYSDTHLFITLLELNEILKKKRVANKIKKIVDEVADQFKLSKKPNQSEINLKAAKYHGIPLEKLIDSPNYSKLVNAYRESIIKKVYKRITEELDFSGAEAWALILGGLGFLDHFLNDIQTEIKKSHKK